jgi:Cu(I)/Ag(I) efflux system membrane fusion protein
MKGKNILIFLSGILVTLALVGSAGYLKDLFHSASSPVKVSMEGMAGPPQAEDMGSMKDQSGVAQAAVMVSPARQQLIGVKTGVVKEQPLETVIRTVGTVDYDEQHIRQINLRISGWITHLFADYTGKSVNKGDPLITLYSPDLVSTQEEYLLSKRTLERVQASPMAHIRAGAEAQLESARNRLLLWNLTEAQIAELEQHEKPQRETTLFSPIDGVVTKKMALQGMYVTPEMSLYEIADLSTVWVYADIYEYELPIVKVGQEAIVTLASYPGEVFRGRVIYIYPYLSTETRTVKIRMEFSNPQGKLKPGMYGDAQIKTKAGKKLAIPQEAVLDSGTRKLVFVDKGQGMYEPREVKLGNKADQFYPVLEGLTAGETVVTSATFLIDSESKLMAATSMMGALGMGGIRMEQAQMGQMEMGGMKGMEGMEMASESTARTQTVDGLTLTLVTDPQLPKKGENRLHLTIRAQEAPVTDAKVTMAYTMAMPGMEAEIVEAKHTKNGIYTTAVDFGMKGVWDIEVTVVRGQSNPVKAKFTFQVEK